MTLNNCRMYTHKITTIIEFWVGPRPFGAVEMSEDFYLKNVLFFYTASTRARARVTDIIGHYTHRVYSDIRRNNSHGLGDAIDAK